MPSVKPPPTVIPFGVFEADLSSLELRKHGKRLRLPRQSFQILRMLLERPGELVTREDLRAALWPSDTFVDFEHGLNAAINRLRETLGDDADAPRYVETLPRRGYRYIGPPPALGAAPPKTLEPQATEEATGITPAVEPAPAPTTAASAEPRPHAALISHSVFRFGAPLVVVGLLGAAFGLVVHYRSHKITDKDPIVMTDFANSTGDPVFDDTLRQGLVVQLEQSPLLNVVQENTIDETLRFMGRKRGEPLTKEQWREVCERSNSTTLLGGSIALLGSQYVIGLNAEECKTGRHLADEQVQVASKEEVLKGLGKAASSLRKKLGENVASLQKFDLPLEQVTTPSLEALQAYTRGQKTFDEKGYTLAIPFFQRAIELDPNFASAHDFLAVAYHNIGRDDLGQPFIEKAYALRDHASERESLLISSIYTDWVLGNVPKDIEILQVMAQTFPRASVAHLLLAARYSYLGRYSEAINEEHEALRLDRSSASDYNLLGLCYLRSGQLDMAETTLKDGLVHYPGLTYFEGNFYLLAFLRGDTARMEQALSNVAGKDNETWLLTLQADTEAYYGRMKRSRQFSNRAVALARNSGSHSLIAMLEAEAATREAGVGNLVPARQHAEAAFKEKPSGLTLAMLGLVLAKTGDAKRAEAICKSLEKENPENTFLREYWLPLIYGEIALSGGDATSAVTAVEPAMAFNAGYGRMYPAYFRGQLLLQTRDGVGAATEFQKVIDHPTIVVNQPYGALAKLGLARAYAVQGKTELARVAYQAFFTLWKDADPDAPPLNQAKAEYAKLQ
jgi:DNA-binding winged helix-turn-helix (wHTH) protein/tetratricopeptide (TPR) repeat protein